MRKLLLQECLLEFDTSLAHIGDHHPDTTATKASDLKVRLFVYEWSEPKRAAKENTPRIASAMFSVAFVGVERGL